MSKVEVWMVEKDNYCV